MTDEAWKWIQKVTEEFNQPHEFVTIPGEELSYPDLGHHNVYWLRSYPEIIKYPDKETLNAEGLFKLVRSRGDEVIIIPHHTMTIAHSWDLNHYDEELEPLVEIYSMWGSSECTAEERNPRPILRIGGEVDGSSVRNALDRGYRVGIIAAGDIHDGRPGRCLQHSEKYTGPHWGPFYPSGIAAVYAPELTREAVFRALKNRSCYGTTGARIIIEFSINEHPMGSEFSYNGNPTITFRAIGTGMFKQVEVIKNGCVLYYLEGYGETINESFVDTEKSGKKTDYYYLRAIQKDGNIAWSSPVWIDH